MTNANINSFTVNTSIVGTTKFYAAVSPYGATDDSAVTFTTMNSYMNHNTLLNYDANQHRAMDTSNSSIVVWSGYQINSLLNTKLNSVSLATYATSAALNAHTTIDSIHRGMATAADTIVTWSGYHINSLLNTKLNSVNLSTYATSADLATTTGKTETNSTNINDHISISSIHRGMGTSNSTIVAWSGFQINSLLNTKLNSINTNTFATSANLATTTGLTHTNSTNINNHINSIQVHTNHNSVFVDTSSGLAGGGDLTSTRSLYLDVNGLTAITSADPGADFLALHSTSITSVKKIKPFEMWGTMETTDISTTTYSVQSSDFGKKLRFTGTAAQTITFGNDDTLSAPTHATIMFTNINTNGVNFTGSTSSSVNHPSGFTKSNSIYQVGGCQKDSAQTWLIWGVDA